MNREDFNPKLDLVIERTVNAPPERIWQAWTEPERLKRWFTPAPWITAEAEIDLRPGGIFRTVMRGPSGEQSVNNACYLEIVPNQRLVWTIALQPGFRPTAELPIPLENVADRVPAFSAIVTFEKHGAGTKYRAVAKHRDEAGAKQHLDMGFHDGWGAVTDQMIALVTEG